MKRVHVALAVADLDKSINEYTGRLGEEPVCVVPGTYALWRTGPINLSITVNPDEAGKFRHLGLEDPDAPAMTASEDPDGFVWEHFSGNQQKEEIFNIWPHAKYAPTAD